MTVVFPEGDGEKLADEFELKLIELARTEEFVEILEGFEVDVDAGCAGRSSALMISAAFDRVLAIIPLGEGQFAPTFSATP